MAFCFGDQGAMVRLRSLMASAPTESETWTARMNVPDVTGVPEISPMPESDRPSGHLPDSGPGVRDTATGRYQPLFVGHAYLPLGQP